MRKDIGNSVEQIAQGVWVPAFAGTTGEDTT